MRAGALKCGAQPKCLQKRRCTERKSHYAENYAKSDLRSIGRQHAVFDDVYDRTCVRRRNRRQHLCFDRCYGCPGCGRGRCGGFNKFSGYIKLEAMYPTESKDLNNSSYAEWNAIVSLYIDNATNPMDYGNTHFYFRCQAEAQYMQNWDSADMKPYTTAATDAYNFNRDVNSSNPEDHLYKDISQSSYGAELVLDYNISIKANVPNKATKKRNTITTANGSAKDISTLRNEISEINTALNNGGAVYNYKDLAIIAPNGLRYMETYFIAGNGVNNRSGIDSRDTVVIDNKIRNSDGKCFTDLFEKVTDDEFVNKRQGFAYRSKSGNTIPKETWEWFWRNAIDVKNESTLVDCYTTADTTSGKFKILLVHTDNKQIVAEYIDDAYSDLVLPVGNYKVYLVGKDDAAFNVSISLYCFGENVSWYEPSKK